MLPVLIRRLGGASGGPEVVEAVLIPIRFQREASTVICSKAFQALIKSGSIIKAWKALLPALSVVSS